jgi:hypothetical protein
MKCGAAFVGLFGFGLFGWYSCFVWLLFDWLVGFVCLVRFGWLVGFLFVGLVGLVNWLELTCFNYQL